MAHPTHKLKAYCGDVRKKLVFCEQCGKEEDEAEINEPCKQSFYEKKVDIVSTKLHPEFVSGLS